MNPLLHDLPYDDTGHAADNRTKREFHDLSKQVDLPFRVFAMDKGYFYTDDILLVDGRGYTLIEDVDYQCTCIHPEIVIDSGLTAAALVVIKNPRVHHEIYVDAQMVGGSYKSVGYSIVELTKGLLNNTRKVHWVNIEQKPDAFLVNGHLHALWDLYGFTPRTAQLKRMTAAIQLQGQNAFDTVFDDFVKEMDKVKAERGVIDALLLNHIQNKLDPHDVTKVQVGLSQLPNAPRATIQQAKQANDSVRNAYATPWSVKQAIAANFSTNFTNHVNNTNNPHRLTASQLLAYSITEMGQLLVNYYDLGSTVTKSTLWMGLSGRQQYLNARANNTVVNFTSGILKPERYAIGGAQSRDWMLAGNGAWLNIRQAIQQDSNPKPVNVYFEPSIASADTATLNRIYGDPTVYPIGTLVIFRNYVTWGIDGYRTTTVGQQLIRRAAADRLPSDWNFNAAG